MRSLEGKRGRGETGKRKLLVPASSPLRLCAAPARPSRGWTLIELLVTVTVMSVLALGAIPMLKVAIRRQKEYELRDALRTMREAIKEFRRDTIGMQCQGGLPGGGLGTGPGPAPGGGTVGEGGAAGGGVAPIPGQQGQPGQQQQGGGQPWIDPRSQVVIGDCTIFTVDNPDRYPPNLETLVDGVNVVPRNQPAADAAGSLKGDFLSRQEGGGLAFKKKKYLREVPVDPMTGKADWVLCSSWEDQTGDACGGRENVFDVRSRSQETALNGKEKYSDW